MYPRYFKRSLDFIIALIAILALFLFSLLITLLLFITNHGHPFFPQSLPGKNGKIFKIIKFKTMNGKRGKEGNLLPDARRLTALGKFVNKDFIVKYNG